MCGNASSKPRGGYSLNSEAVRLKAAARWGAIKNPTVEEIAQMVLKAADEHGWDNIVVWKMDPANAFGLLFRFSFALETPG